ncbi:oligomeric golgi complex component, COG2-domain-containing protein [Phakopsora pachyrhizi]|uniref:Conserved oligomeric Golgi complex subunit 2 n=1 Tax=Phakopsora pachyrhizi TaxID=170000 RepID=A0AAV0AWQ0_PHAPC|nr:oligomeric golgi complex component, COG2-domain-containing protein [Phakopsora pachyrhizi]CAH7674663.1 oligomeric golgi complex component, COG2-domain-containing protein [Phakopsora pachyrhizi]
MTLPSSSSIKLDSQQSPSTPKSRILVPGDSVEDSFEAPTPSSIELLQAPKPLSHWVFRDPNFDCDEFLYSRRLISLDDLRTELRDYLSGLKSELVGVINEDYEDFIGLGMGLRSTVEQTMGKLKVPLEELRKRVLLISQNLDQQRAEVEGLLSERRKVIDGKKLVRLMLDCGDAVTKVEGMLSIQQLSTSDQAVSPTKIIDSRAMARNRSSSSRYSVKLDLPLDSLEGSAVIEARAKRVERITNEYNQMLYLVSKGSNLAYVDQLKPRIELVTETLHRGLGSLFRSTLHTPRSDHRKRHCLLECLRAYEALEAVSEAEDIIKEELVVPGMSKIVHRNSLNPGAMSPVLPVSPEVARFKIDSKNSSSNRFNTSTVTAKFLQLALPDDPEQVPLPLLYNKILAFIAREMALILDAADQLSKHSNQQLNNKDLLLTNNNSHSKPTYNILVNSIISPTLQLIVSTVGSSLFASGNPSTFHRNYSCTVNFLYRLEAFCSSPRQVLNLRAHPDWQNFRNKWQLPVYAQIRTKEMIYSIEDGLSDDLKHSETYSKTGGNLKDSKYLLRSSETVNRVISVLWQDDVFLTDLTHRFWRLTLMALSRYKTWLDRITSTYNLLDESDPSTLPQRASIESNRVSGN